jgi:hypothetical protein
VARSIRIGVIGVMLTVVVACGGTSSSTTASAEASGNSIQSGMTAEAWAASVCASFSDYMGAVAARQDAFDPNATNIKALKRSWLEFLDGMIADLDALIADLEATGTPEAQGGAAASQALIGGFSKLQRKLKDLRDTSTGLPTSSPDAFVAEFSPLIERFQTDVSDLANVFSEIQSPELDAAFTTEPACASVR